jgi:hypothetical protein
MRARRTHARACARKTIHQTSTAIPAGSHARAARAKKNHQPSNTIIPEEGVGAAAAFLCHYYFLRT